MRYRREVVYLVGLFVLDDAADAVSIGDVAEQNTNGWFLFRFLVTPASAYDLITLAQ